MSDYPFPSGLYYEPQHHLWARPEADGRVVVGIDVLGLENLGDLAYVSVRAVGEVVRRGEPVGSLEAAKMTGEIASPVGGRIVARNGAAVENPRLVNNDPYGEGWLVVLEPEDWNADAAALLSGDAVGPWVESELARFREEGWLD